MDPFHYISIQTFYKINMNGSIPLHIHTKIGGSNIRVYSSSTPPFQSPWTLTLVCCLFFPVPVDSYPCLLSFLSSPRGLLPLFVVFSFQSPWTLTLVCWLCFTVPVDSYPCLLALLYSPRSGYYGDSYPCLLAFLSSPRPGYYGDSYPSPLEQYKAHGGELELKQKFILSGARNRV